MTVTTQPRKAHTARKTTHPTPSKRARKATRKAEPFDPVAHAAECIQSGKNMLKSQLWLNRVKRRASMIRAVFVAHSCYLIKDITGDPKHAFEIENAREMLRQLADEINPNDLLALADMAMTLVCIPFDAGLIEDMNRLNANQLSEALAECNANKAAERKAKRETRK